MAHEVTEQMAPGAAESSGKVLFRLGGVAALLAAGFAVVQMVIEIIGVGVMGIAVPSTVVGWFLLLQSDRLLGLTELTLFQLAVFTLLTPMFLAVNAALNRSGPALVPVATALALVGIAAYLPSNPAFPMLALSEQWTGATTDARRDIVQAAGETIMAISAGPGLVAGASLVATAVVIDCVVMRRSQIFARPTPYVGILAAVAAAAAFAAGPSAGILVLEAAAAIFLLWIVLVARGLFDLAGA